jgi:hypothetical protein
MTTWAHRGAPRGRFGFRRRLLVLAGALGVFGSAAQAQVVALDRSALEGRVDAMRAALGTVETTSGRAVLVAQPAPWNNWNNFNNWGNWGNWFNR